MALNATSREREEKKKLFRFTMLNFPDAKIIVMMMQGCMHASNSFQGTKYARTQKQPSFVPPKLSLEVDESKTNSVRRKLLGFYSRRT